MKKLVFQAVSAGIGLWLASMFVPGVKVELLSDSNFFGVALTAQWQVFLVLGVALGLLIFFAKPILNIITLPLRILTLGLFGLAVNMALIWLVDAAFRELSAPWFWPLLWTSLIVWALNAVIVKTFVKEEN